MMFFMFYRVVRVDLPGVNDVGEWNPKPVKILERKLIKKGLNPVVMVLVQWEHGSAAEATWETWDKLMKKFPDFNP